MSAVLFCCTYLVWYLRALVREVPELPVPVSLNSSRTAALSRPTSEGDQGVSRTLARTVAVCMLVAVPAARPAMSAYSSLRVLSEVEDQVSVIVAVKRRASCLLAHP